MTKAFIHSTYHEEEEEFVSGLRVQLWKFILIVNTLNVVEKTIQRTK